MVNPVSEARGISSENIFLGSFPLTDANGH